MEICKISVDLSSFSLSPIFITVLTALSIGQSYLLIYRHTATSDRKSLWIFAKVLKFRILIVLRHRYELSDRYSMRQLRYVFENAIAVCTTCTSPFTCVRSKKVYTHPCMCVWISVPEGSYVSRSTSREFSFGR